MKCWCLLLGSKTCLIIYILYINVVIQCHSTSKIVDFLLHFCGGFQERALKKWTQKKPRIFEIVMCRLFSRIQKRYQKCFSRGWIQNNKNCQFFLSNWILNKTHQHLFKMYTVLFLLSIFLTNYQHKTNKSVGCDEVSGRAHVEAGAWDALRDQGASEVGWAGRGDVGDVAFFLRQMVKAMVLKQKKACWLF